MTGVVLALAGLTCGDGGPGSGAAREPVTAGVKLPREFSALMRVPGGPLLEARLVKGDLHISYPSGSATFHRCAFTGDEARGFRLEWGGNVYRGDASRGPQGVVLTLRTFSTKAGAHQPRLLPDLLRRGGPAQ
jgi:hypothetical protein